MKFVFDVIVPAELPADINAFKSQQFRWAKGSIQTAKKVLPRVFAANIPFNVKMHSFLHTTHYMIHPFMLLTAVLAPFLLMSPLKMDLPNWMFIGSFIIIILAAIAPSVLYFVAQQSSGYRGWQIRLLAMPVLMSLGVGIAVNNTRAVFSALTGIKGAFVRTPKKGNKSLSAYGQAFPFLAVVEMLVGVLCVWGLLEYIDVRKFIIGPFLALYAVGFLAVGVLSLMHYQSNLMETRSQAGSNKA